MRRTVSATRPIPIESELTMLIAPRSCSTFSAAMPCSLTRLRVTATSLSMWWFCRCTVIVIGNSSPAVFVV
ncbi:hypothetical protein GCM10020001_092560 [Nonomuraea salmonea]